MATVAELTVTVATLTERVTNHIKFFWVAVGCGFTWLAAISLIIYNTNAAINRVEKAQANAPAQIVASLLGRTGTSKTEVATNLAAVSSVLQSSKVGSTRPDASALKKVSAKLLEVQQQYPDLPQVWQATGAFINYKSEALLPPLSKTPMVSGRSCKGEFGRDGVVFSNCEIALEDLAQSVHDNTINGLPIPFTFVNCIVHYSGGAIPAKDLTFLDSVFRFQVPTVPPREGILAMRQLTTTGDERQIKLSLG